MNITEWLNSIDEFLYQLVSWIVFYPVTLWKVLRRPLTMMDYAESELAKVEDDQYLAALAPPIFLILSLAISFVVGIAVEGSDNAIVRDHHGLANLVNDDKTLFFFRIILFCTFPLILATETVVKTGTLDRRTLKAPFYAQCYAAAPFALGLSIGVTLSLSGPATLRVAGVILLCASLIGYTVVQTVWFARRLDRSPFAGFVHACVGLAMSTLVTIAMSYALLR